VSLRVWHTSDLHDRRGLVGSLRALRAREPGLLFDCGDSLRGSQTVFHRREPIIAEIDAAGYDAQGMGNREFHYLFGAVAARARQMHHPLICSNLIDLRGRQLPFARDAAFAWPDGEKTWKVRVFALLVVQYPQGSPWERLFGWRFLDPIDVAREIAAETPDDTVLIALSHLGLRTDRRLGAAVPRLDLILGGHSHDLLREVEYAGRVPIVHAGPYGAFASRTELDAAPGGRTVVARYDLVPLSA
jgi:2',3'-cyclic-nucleotide 2'-phosphodiesterase (5'-nucleotidase family)